MDPKVNAGDAFWAASREGVSLTVGKALALSFSIAIALAAVFVAAGVLVTR